MTHHFQPLLHWCCTLQVLSSSLDVVFNIILTEIDHVAGEEGLAVFFEIFLIRIQKTIQPWQELLGTVVGVEDNWNTICWSNGTNEEGSSNTSGNRSLLLAISNTLFPSILVSESLGTLLYAIIPFRRSRQRLLGTSEG